MGEEMSEIRMMIRYCTKGHEIKYQLGGIARSRCPVCGSPVDRSRPPITQEEAQRIKEQQAMQEAERLASEEAQRWAAQQAEEEAERQVAQKTLEEAERQTAEWAERQMVQQSFVPGNTPQQGLMLGSTSQQGFMPGGASQQQDFMPGNTPQQGFMPGTPQRSFMPGNSLRPSQKEQYPASQHQDSVGRHGTAGAYGPSTFFLNLYGDRIPIPAEGAWIGREGVGSQWFDGNLMISRKHVYVRPNPQTGRLQVNEDKSLNGVFYSAPGGERIRMDGPRMMSPGEVLWIYNIPLRIER